MLFFLFFLLFLLSTILYNNISNNFIHSFITNFRKIFNNDLLLILLMNEYHCKLIFLINFSGNIILYIFHRRIKNTLKIKNLSIFLSLFIQHSFQQQTLLLTLLILLLTQTNKNMPLLNLLFKLRTFYLLQQTNSSKTQKHDQSANFHIFN